MKRLPVHPTSPPYEDKIVELLRTNYKVLAVPTERNSFKYYTTNTNPDPAAGEQQIFEIFVSKDVKGVEHYILITTTWINDKHHGDAIIIVPLEELPASDVKIVGNIAEVNEVAFDNYKDDMHRVG